MNLTTNRFWPLAQWACVILLGCFAFVSNCGGITSVNAAAVAETKAVSPVINPCPRLAAGAFIPATPALFSADGVLSLKFSYQTRSDTQGRQLYCFMTPEGLENPTLYLNPGDRLKITITNNTPAGMDPMVLNPPNCGATIMDSSSVNIHYHGTNTSPMCGADDVIKTAVNAGQTFEYDVAFPANEPPGLYWYHPHIHGIADHAVLGGAAGAIVIEGIHTVQPLVAGLPSHVLVIRDQTQVQGLDEGPGGCTNDVPFRDLTVNNVPVDSFQAQPGGPVTFTPAKLEVRPHQKQFWRVTNSSADSILDLQLQYDGVAQKLRLVAIDGVAVNSQDGTGPAGTISVNHFRLPPASRVEFIATTPWPGVALAQLVTTSITTGAAGDCDPDRPIFTLVQSRHERDDAESASALTSSSKVFRRFAGLAEAPIAQSRLVYFDEDSGTNQFFMVVAGQPEKIFDPNAPPAIVATQGTVEQWTVENHALENHEFHFHQVHFLLQSQNHFETNGQPKAPGIDGQFLDMVEVPGWDGNPAHPYPSVSLLIDFRGPDIGLFVFHCHILNHEDLGMMNIIQVVPAGSAQKGSSPGGPAKPPAPSAASLKPAVAGAGAGGGK